MDWNLIHTRGNDWVSAVEVQGEALGVYYLWGQTFQWYNLSNKVIRIKKKWQILFFLKVELNFE